MKRRKRWRVVLIVLGILVVVAGAGLYAFDYAFNRLMGSLAESILEETDSPGQPLETPVGGGGTGTDASRGEPGGTGENPVSSAGEAGSSASEPQGGGSGAGPAGPGSAEGGSSGSAGGGSSDKPSETYIAEVSADKLQQLEKRVTFSEKTAVTSILLRHLGAADIRLFRELAGDGLSVEDKRTMKKVLLDKLTPEEYDKLVAIAKKYGLSEGKTYQESISSLQ
jgi:hypothetical protein